jgi:hypothetical protein
MEISVNSWHYKILSDCQKSKMHRKNTTFCSYFWSVVSAIMVWITVGVACICLSIIFLMCVYWVGYIYYFAFTDYFSLVQTFDSERLYTSLVINVLVVFAWSLRLFFLGSKTIYYKAKEIEIPESKNILVQYVKAKKNKYCPMIEFKI